MAENLGAADLAPSAEELQELDAAASKIAIQGDRYPEELEKRTGL